MSGSATNIGTLFQARVAARVLAYMLAQRPLGWLKEVNDVPVELTAETGGPGDDLRIGIAGPPGSFELQAKHGLSGEPAVIELLEGIAARQLPGADAETVIAIDQSSSSWIYSELAPHLESRRCGRPDAMGVRSRRVLDRVPTVTRRLSVRLVHVDDSDNADRLAAMAYASDRLADLGQSNLLWDVLCEKGHELASGRTLVTHSSLIDLLEAKGIRLKRSAVEQFAIERLDEVTALFSRGELDAARALLRGLSKLGIDNLPVGLRARYSNQCGVLAYRTDKFDDAHAAWRAALDLQPSHVSSLCNLSNLQRERGVASDALSLAERALAVEPESSTAWVQRLFALDSLGQSALAPAPPRVVEESAEYRVALAGIAAEDDRWFDARLHSLAAIQKEESTEALLMRAMVLANAPAASPTDERDELAGAERLATRVLERIPSPADRRRAYTLILRADVRRQLGDAEGAQADLVAAGEGGRFEPNGVRLQAINHVRAQRPGDALAVLEQPDVESVPLLLALRAEIRLMISDEAGARRDLDAARRLVIAGEVSDEDRFAIAHIAIELQDVSLAEVVVAPLNDVPQLRALASRALVAFAKREWPEGKALIREAVTKGGASDVRDIVDMALEALAKGERWDDVIAWVEEFDLRAQPNGARRLAEALTESRRYREVDLLVRELSEKQPVPAWVRRLRLHLAKLREDPAEALAAIKELQSAGEDSVELLVDEVRYLFVLGRAGDARERLATLRLRVETLSPEGMAFVAELAARLGNTEDAAYIAFLAYRRAPMERVVVQALMRRLLPTEHAEQRPTILRNNTAATLVDAESSAERSVVILDRTDADPLRDEYPPTSPLAALLLGKSEGDEILMNSGSPYERRFRVTEVLPVWVPALRDAMLNAEERFPEQPLARRIHVGTDASLTAIARIAQATNDRAQFVQGLMTQYRDGSLPLPMVAEAMNVPLPELIDELTTPGSKQALYTAEGVGQEYLAAVQSVQEASMIVVTLDAVVGIDVFDLYDAVVASAISIVVPQSLMLRLSDLETQVSIGLQHGRQSLALDAAGALRMIDVPRETLSLWRDRYARMKDWLTKHAEARSRPLSSLERETGIGSRTVRAALGEVPLDAMDIASDAGGVLHTDDLLIRRLAIHELHCRGCSTVSLIEALADRGVITVAQRHGLRLRAIRRRWHFVPVDAKTLLAAIDLGADDGPECLRLSLERCAAPHVSLDIAIEVAAQTCRLLALASVQQMTPAAFAGLAATIFSSRWSRREVVRLFQRALQRTLALLPVVRDEIRDTLAAG